MVRKSTKIVRCGPYFAAYTQELKRHARVSDAQLTDGLAKFLDEQRLTPILLRRAQDYHKRPPKGVFG